VAALVTQETGADADVLEGSRGEFSVWVGDTCVAKKTREGFPEDGEIVSAVRRSLGGT
jgi:hypothetical protein